MPVVTYDIVIVGAGPAGLSAALTARARNLSTLLISNSAENSPLAKAARIDNYPGMPGVNGLDLLHTMTSQALFAGAELICERVISILPLDPGFLLTVGSDVIQARAVILAIGAQTAKPLPGETEYLGRGVSYCATCDGMLYRNRKVAVLGLSDDAVSEANFLVDIGCEVVFITPCEVSGLNAQAQQLVGRISSLSGDNRGLTAVSVVPTASGEGAGSAVSAMPARIACEAAFLLRPSIAPDAMIAGLQLQDGFIAVSPNMATSIPGVFAAGDCTGLPHQIAKAVGEGQIAAFSAQAFLGG